MITKRKISQEEGLYSVAAAKISFTPVSIKEAGYMYIYLSYENESNNYVYFDDMKVTHTRSNVIQYNEYYPFGLLTSNSWTRESNTGNNFLYNGPTETNTTTGLIETFFRGYDPVLGRFMQVDPLAHYASSLNPYQYANNNSVRYNDPTGLFVWADVVTLWNNTPANGFSSWTDGQTPHYYEPTGGGGYTEVGGEGSSYNGGPGGYVQIGKSGNNLSIYTTTVQPAIYNSNGERLQDQINSMDYVEMSLPQVENSGNGPFDQFVNGFSNGPRSEEITATNLVSGWGSISGATNAAVRNDARYISNFSKLRQVATASKYVKNFGTGLGVVGILSTGIESALDGNLSIGDGTKFALAFASVACPVFGIVYGLTDLAFQFGTETSLTDRIANGLDSALPNANFKLGY